MNSPLHTVKIGMFAPDAIMGGAVQHLTVKERDLKVRIFDSFEGLQNGVITGVPELEAVIIPLATQAGQNGIGLTARVKADPITGHLPIVGISQTADQAILRAFYGAGADAVIVAPVDGEHILLQVDGLLRFKAQLRSSEGSTRPPEEEQSKDIFRRSVEAALSCLHEGVMITDHNFEILFVNDAARSLLGLEGSQASEAAKQFETIISGEKFSDGEIRAYVTEVRRCDEQSFRAEVRLSPVFGQGGLAGYSISFLDLAITEYLQLALSQNVLARELLIEEQAKFVRGPGTGTIIGSASGPVPLRTSAYEILSKAIEFLDPLIPVNTSISVQVPHELYLDVPATVLFRLLTTSLLVGSDFSGASGDMRITGGASRRLSGKAILDIAVVTKRRQFNSHLIGVLESSVEAYRGVDSSDAWQVRSLLQTLRRLASSADIPCAITFPSGYEMRLELIMSLAEEG